MTVVSEIADLYAMSQPPNTAESSKSHSLNMQQSKPSKQVLTKYLDPPSSPPPSSPLPLLPISPSSNSSTRSHTPSPRPPRQQISLPDLRTSTARPANGQQKGFHVVVLSPDSKTQLQSPFTSPIKNSERVARHAYSPVPPPTQSKSHSSDNLHADLYMKSGNGRIWWSPIPENPSAEQDVPSDWPLSSPVPQIPPRSRKRKTQRLPNKAVARSPLHIPPGTVSIESLSTEPLINDSRCQGNTPLLHRESITSLPPWPDAPDEAPTTMNKSHCLSHADAGSVNQPGSLLVRNSISTYERQSTIGSEKEKHISFRAVTNLEGEPFALRQATSPLGDSIDAGLTPDTSPRKWYQLRRKQIWILTTILAVLLCAGGILVGTIWRLNHTRR